MTDVPDGRHRARAQFATLNYTSTGKERVTVSFELLDADGVTCAKQISWDGYFSEKSMELTVRALRACGWKGDDLANLAGIDTNEVEVVVEHEEYNGRSYPRVRWVNEPSKGVGVQAPMDSTAAKSFAARMRARIRELDASTGNGKKPSQPRSRVGGVMSPEPPPQMDDSDIPF